MPNWCENLLRITGPEESLKSFKLTANGLNAAYNSLRGYREDSWGPYEDIRVKAILSITPVGDISPLSFHALYPIPEEIRRLPYDGVEARKASMLMAIEHPGNGYDWEIENWGVKWGASDSVISLETSERIEYLFVTPWAPPILLLKNIAPNWNMLNFHLSWEEPGMNLRGEIILEGGALVSETEEHFDGYDDDTETGPGRLC